MLFRALRSTVLVLFAAIVVESLPGFARYLRMRGM